MIPQMNSRQMQQMMRKMGIQQEDIEADEVIIKTAEKTIRILNPSVAKVNAMGQETFQISGGEVVEEEMDTTPQIDAEDIATVMEQAQVDEQTASQAILDANGDLAQAILTLNERNN